MATVDGNDVASLASRIPTPIAQLNPDLPDQTSRVVRGDVTITWPYNSVTQRFAFLLAEPDVRLRRAKGQIRVELQGTSAKAAAECGIGAGDELLFSLAGAGWSTDPAPGRIPGARVEWQLQFSKKLACQVKSGESGDLKHINVDQPTSDQPDIPVQPPRLATPEPEPIPSQIPTTGRKISELTADEYPSPAFVKRARLSYGALFEGGFDIFEEDGGIRGRGRKRTRFGRNSSTWRYSSHSPSPEPSSPVPDAMDEDTQDMETVHPSPKPEAMDEGCQTIEVEMVPAASELDATTVQQQKKTASAPGTPVRASREVATAHMPEEQTTEVEAVQHVERPSVSPVVGEKTAPLVNKQDVGFEKPCPVADSSPAAETRERSPSPLVEREQHEEQSSTTVTQPTSLPASSIGAVSSGLDGRKSSTSNFSFDADVPSRVESSLSLADQVRFGFSHVPQTTHSSSPQNAEPAPELDKHHQEQYPTAYLDGASTPAKYAEANTFSNAADENGGMAFYDQAMPPVPLEVERFDNGQWEMSSQSEHYNLVEGGHFGTDALNEGARVMVEQQSLHAEDIAPDRVPEGFASYGKEDALGARGASPPTRSSPHEDDSFVENDGTVSEDESSVDEEEDEDEKFDKAAFGEQIEEGDHDQRNYEVPSDDDEALSEEDEEVELEAEERYGNEEVYDEDGEGEEWDEDEDYESEDVSEEEDYEAAGYQARDAAAPRGDPVVISLLSDSEDEDEPAPPPKTSASVRPTTHAPEPPSASEPITNPEGHESPASAHGSPSLDHESCGSERHESPDSERHESPGPERHESPGSERHESPGLKRHEFPNSEHDELSSPERHPSHSPERSDSPAVLETVEADNTSREQASESIFSQTDVIDFATRHTHSVDQQPKVIPAEVDAYTRSPSFASQIISSFDVSDALEEAGGHKFEPSPSDNSSGLFVSQINRQSAPSESSSEGLFISQPRQKSADVKGRLSDSGSTDEAEGIDEASVNEPEVTDGGTIDELAEADKASTGGGMELELEDSKSRSQSLSADEMDQDVPAPSPPKSSNEDASLPDADALSFTSQVEMPVEFGESEDEHMSVDEDVSLRHANDVDTVMSTFEVEDATASEDDVDMLDAGSEQVGSGSPERMATRPEKDGTVDMSTALSDRVVTETISEVISTASADGPLPDAPTLTGKEQEAQSPNLGEHKFARAAEDVPGRQHGVFGAVDERQGESSGSVRGSLSDASFKSQAGSAEHEAPDATQESSAQVSVKDAATPPTHLPHVVDEADGAHVEATNCTGSVGPSDEETNAGLQQDGSPDKSTPARSDTAVTPDGTPSVNEPAVASTPAENEKEGQVNDAEKSARQEQELETTQHPTSPTEELDDEALIQEQLSQEQQQSFETEPAESQGRARTRSSSPDFSVHLARQAIAAKRHKKFAEPVRTSSRIARTRSSSLRSNTTNGSPEQEKEKEEDPSVSLARAALASPSRRSAGPSTSTSTATFTSVTALKADLNKRLRTELPECVPLRSLRAHLDKTPNVIAVVTSQPTTPARAKGGPREYVMSFHVTDPSAAPNTVVEVQMYRPHKDSLPIVGPGDIVLLSRFLVKAVSKKGWGLRTGMESAWAVWEGVRHEQQRGEEGYPQIRGPPVEDWQGYVGYVRTLREWWALVMADEAARGKLERADRKLMEVK
ncbi:hypothetical protein C7999DRAFT_33769 [Corynascus novoguineensis]|uniref:Telomeric single stranded DNA binding POT1/Cdc13 domain-containing protein n=1 Tax=Corynascus novoguineensis TaxID=1126955 RepID=A0AAN7HHL5_9PEZI|nr:hypothetical protein C7999DRAFT_33769 [Corynascus novoguineensis]